MIGLSGLALTAEERDLLNHPQVGGVILFSRNYESPAQLAGLTASVHALRDPPLLVAVDQEGGRVQRFRTGFTPLPAVAGLGAVHDRDAPLARRLAESSGWLMAAELRGAGVDFSFAPVLDLGKGVSHVIGDRAFHAEPEVVAELARCYARGMKAAGMAATGKHFPGHGSVTADSHHELPVDQRRLEDLQVEDLLPFERMAHYGFESMMAAHVLYPEIDDKPAGFSRFWLQEVLRRRLGFQGAIFSDDLHMEGAGFAGDMVERARCALRAGCDMILVCQDPDAIGRVVDGLADWSSPVSQLRLARMHGRFPIGRDELRADERWRRAVKDVGSYGEPHTLDLM